MPEKLKSDLRLNRLRKAITKTGGSPVADFQRFNISGFDFKGQMSSGYGEHGYGASLGFSFDWGGLILPGLFTMELSAKITGAIGRRSMLILQRDPSRVKRRPVRQVRKRVKAPWKNNEPLDLMLLRGRTKTGQFKGGGEIKFGVGDPYETDELGAAIGAKVEVGATLEGTDLRDPAPRHYASAMQSGLARDVEFLLNDRIKRALALWVLEADVQKKLFTNAKKARKAIIEAAPNELDGSITAVLAAIDDETINAELEKLPAFSADLKGLSKWLFRAKSAGIGKWNRPGEQTLIDALEGHRKWRQKELDEVDKELSTLVDAAGKPVAGANKRRINDLTKTRDRFREEIGNIREMRLMLSRRQIDKAHRMHDKVWRQGDHDPEKKESWQAKVPGRAAYLKAVTRKGGMTAQAGLKLNASIPRVIKGALGASGSVESYYSRIGYSYQTASQAAHFSGSKPTRIASRQETQITYKCYLSVDAQAKAEFRTFLNSDYEGEKQEKGSWSFGTMTYRSVNVAWRSTDSNRRRVVLPNGCGLTKGISILGGRIRDYASACYVAKKYGVDDPDPAKVAGKLEEFLMQQLGTDQKTLRAFFAAAPYDWIDADPDLKLADRSMLVEACYAFDAPGRRGQSPLTFGLIDRPAGSNNPPETYEQSLFTLKPASTRLKQKNPDTEVDSGNGSSHLQVLRLRFRQAELHEKTRPLFSLGFTTTDDGDVRRANVKDIHGGGSFGGPAVFRTYRAGYEGTFDFHTMYYGETESTFNESKKQNWAREFTVPPVALFNF